MNEPEHLKVKRNLTALVELSRVINSSLDLEFILNNLLLTCMGKFLSTKGFIALNSDGSLTPKAQKGITNEQIQQFPEIINRTDLQSDNFKNYLESLSILAYDEICSSQECIGIIALGEKLNKSPYSEDDLDFLHTITNIAATAIQNSLMLNELKITNRILDSRISRLNSLFELSKEFGLFSESTKVARLLMYSVIGQFLVQKFAVVSFEGKSVKILESKFPQDGLIGALNKYNIKLITNSVGKKEVETEYSDLRKIGIELIVPMQLQGETKGLILLGKRASESEFSESDIEYIYSVGSLAIVSIENQRLFKEALEKQKLEEDLEIAREIQRNLLPHKIPQFKNFNIVANTVFSKQVGGDYYDVIKLDQNNFCIAIADVSGKGVSAALMMANLQAFLKTICKQGMKIDEATGLINDLISENTTEGKFITFFWALIDDEKKQILYVNAGHNPPLLIRHGKIIKLDKGGIILGVMKTMIPYMSENLQLEKDDVIVLFTDGVSEAMNQNGEEFSDERLEKLSLSLSLCEKTAEDISNTIQNEVSKFAYGAVQSDDITLMVIKVK
jgi:sigma-B regulation protein RsbU (phosphoserine phosphatase)